jgi:hypothetical protein
MIPVHISFSSQGSTGMATRLLRTSLSIAFVAVLGALPAAAHHSYAMFDMNHSVVLQGSVAKVEWVNPHVFLWMYVKKPGGKAGEYDLYAFENGPVNMMVRFGWRKDLLKAGDKLSVLYFPMRDHDRKGGYFVKAVRADGSELMGDPHAPGVSKELAKKTPIEAPKS